jgi:hypothetical protein
MPVGHLEELLTYWRKYEELRSTLFDEAGVELKRLEKYRSHIT